MTKPTLGVLGDSISGGSATEIALPLDHPETLKKFVQAFADAGMNGGGGNVYVQFPHGTLVSPDNLKKVVKKINQGVDKGQFPLKSSNAYRVNRRSQ